jgi:hypothetical protein
MHCVAYYIFLKSLRRQEEFRENPHVKIPPKSPSTNFQSLGKFKNPIFNSEILFPCFRPGRSCGPLGLWPSQPCWPHCPRRPKPPSLAHPARASVASLREYVFPFDSRLPSWSLLPRLPATPRRPAPRLGCRRAVTTSPSFYPP